MKVLQLPTNDELYTLYPENLADARVMQEIIAELARLEIPNLIDDQYALVYLLPIVFPNPRQFAELVAGLPNEEVTR